mmetsp:Transcript_61703/g.151016  ORF Transcript_61703/g.151016 Transcript_61703/m.151016 type:complete len:281 (-) Transcript_61703:588-1430(-)
MELQEFTERFRDDDDIVRECIRAWSESLLVIQSTQPTEDRLDLLAKKRAATDSPLRFVSDRLRDDRQLVMSVLKFNPYQISDASERLKADQEIALFVLESFRDYPASIERPHGLYGGNGRFGVFTLFDHCPRPWRVDVEFIAKAARRHPVVLDVVASSSDNSRLMHGDDAPRLLAIALGGSATAMNVQDDAVDFWVHRYGRHFFYDKLVEFWNHSVARFVRHNLLKFDIELYGIRNDVDDILRAGLDRTRRRHRRYDGFKVAMTHSVSMTGSLVSGKGCG